MDIHTTVGTVEEQTRIEEESREAGVNKFLTTMRKSIAEGRASETPYGALLVKLGFNPYRDKLNEYFNAPLSGHYIKQRNLLLLISDDVDVLAYEVLTTVINHSMSHNTISLSRIVTALMKKLYDNYIYNKIKEDNPKLHTYLGYEFKRASKKKRQELIDKNIKSMYDNFSVPDAGMKLQVGSLLINILENSGANIINTTNTIISRNPLKTSLMFGLTDEAMEIMSSIDAEDIALQAVERMPCVVVPNEWRSVNNGGYLTFNDKLVNFGNSKATRDFQREQDYRKLFPIINKLQAIPWRVNAKMLELLDTVYQNDLPVGNLPSSRVKTWEDFMVMPEYDEKNKTTWVEANRKRQQIQIDLDKEFSKRIMLLFSIGTAKKMLKYEKFYYSYQLDYRGRVYPTSTHLNLLGTSEIKSIIEFGEGEYLTADGMRWLKIHLANVYGLDKEPYDDRVSWVDENYDNIMMVANDPLACTELWAYADSPFEYAAACMAYNDALSGEKVYLPIQLDATCSGIQMYSGLKIASIAPFRS